MQRDAETAKSGERKPENAKRVFGLVLVAALALYIVSYATIEHWRNRRGPWQVTFGGSAPGQAWIAIDQHRLGITNVQISFTTSPANAPSQAAQGEQPHGFHVQPADNPKTIVFDSARQVPFDLPLGRCIFLDTTTLPGTVTMQLFGHEIELLPRTLIIDLKEHPWRSGWRAALPIFWGSSTNR